jgi:1,4-alpha-glucan branching enzyme
MSGTGVSPMYVFEYEKAPARRPCHYFSKLLLLDFFLRSSQDGGTRVRFRTWLAVMLLSGFCVSGRVLGAEDANGVPHTFRYAAPSGSPTVPMSITGDFNGWSEMADPMVRGDDGSYAVTLSLKPGVHHYKFVYDGKTIIDPSANKSLQIDNGFGDVLSGVDTSPAKAKTDAVQHVFHFAPPAGTTPAAVDVAGDFNGWSTTATPMSKGGDGSFSATVGLSAGSHQYKFVVDGNWMTDPAGDKSLEMDDQHGGKNSGVNIAATAPTVHTFRYTPAAGAAAPAAVTVVGDFNGWSTTADPLDHNADGSFTATLDIAPGTYHYKFFADNQWVTDPAADKSLETDDGYGGKNSGVKIADAGASTKPADHSAQ